MLFFIIFTQYLFFSNCRFRPDQTKSITSYHYSSMAQDVFCFGLPCPSSIQMILYLNILCLVQVLGFWRPVNHIGLPREECVQICNTWSMAQRWKSSFAYPGQFHVWWLFWGTADRRKIAWVQNFPRVKLEWTEWMWNLSCIFRLCSVICSCNENRFLKIY